MARFRSPDELLAPSAATAVPSDAASPAASPASRRISSLDGLRGLAALSVVVYHIALADPVVGERAFRPDQVSGVGWFGYLMTFTPLHLVWAGTQAVLVFFVLSGFVLALPFVRRPGARPRGTWPGFYRSRAVRLYLPSIVSLVLAYVLASVATHPGGPGLSPWLDEHVGHDGPLDVVLGSSLMTGFGSLNGSLWSLRWEVLFSLSLPVFLGCAAWWVRLNWLKGVLVLAAVALWPVLTGTLYLNATYMLVFAFGVLMAHDAERLGGLAGRIGATGWLGLVLVASVLLTLQWIVMPFGVEPGSLLDRMWMSYNSVGATILVFAAAFSPQARRVLEWRPIHALGVLSFSLYLVQEPVIVRFSLATDAGLPLWLAVPVEVTLALLVATAFYRLVERPAHRLARRARAGYRRAAPRVAASPSTATATATATAPAT